jgi:hypothetical protein
MVGIRSAVVSVQSLLIVSLVLFNALSIRLFWLKRGLFPVKARAPFRTTFTFVFATSGMTIINALVAIFDYEFQCFLWGFFNYVVGINAGLVAIGCRVFELCVNYEAQQLRLLLTDENAEAGSPKLACGMISLETILAHKSDFSKIGFIVYLVTNIPVLVATAMYPQIWIPSNLYVSTECDNFSLVMGAGCAFVAMSLAALILVLYRTLKNGQDNYFLKQELKRLSWSLVWCVVIWIFKKVIPGLSEASWATFGFMDILIVEVPAFWICYVSIFDIARKASTSQEALAQSTRQSSVRDVSTSETPAVQAPRKSLMYENLDIILNSPDLLKLFTEFLCKEFCVENLLFLLAVKKFKEGFNSRRKAENIHHGLSVYDKFIKINSPCEVNISGKCRDILNDKFGESEEMSPAQEESKELATSFKIEGSIIVSETVFDEAYREVAGMLSHDCLRRFKRHVHPSTKQVSMAAIPTPVPPIPESDAR